MTGHAEHRGLGQDSAPARPGMLSLPGALPGGFDGTDATTLVHRIMPGMIGITLRPGARIAGVDGCAARQALLDLTGGQPTTVLLQLTGVRSISRQAMGFHSAATTVTAFAVIGDSPLDLVIAHGRRGLPRPACPSRYFTGQDEATSWLQTHPPFIP
jgi:hypothetical protein